MRIKTKVNQAETDAVCFKVLASQIKPYGVSCKVRAQSVDDLSEMPKRFRTKLVVQHAGNPILGFVSSTFDHRSYKEL